MIKVLDNAIANEKKTKDDIPAGKSGEWKEGYIKALENIRMSLLMNWE